MSVFEPIDINGIKLRNRIIRSATHEGMADENGNPSEKLKKKYIGLAKGGVGAIITGYAGIQADGKSPLYRMLMIDRDDNIARYREITRELHKEKTPIILQIAHCGRQTRSKSTGFKTVAPSAIRDKMYSEEVPEELSNEVIEEIIKNFIEAIVRAKKAGFDGVQLHAAHGYLLSQFLSSYSNRRNDSWGGSLENRYRIIDRIIKGARRKVGNYPILIKLNAHDTRKKGMRIDEAVRIAQLLEKSGCDAIEVSCGCFEDGFYTVRTSRNPIDSILKWHFKFNKLSVPVKILLKMISPLILKPIKPLKNYNVDAAEAIKKVVSIPVIVVGGINNIDDINNIIEGEKADVVSMCRPFIIEPDIVNKFKQGKQKESKCIYCNYCAVAQDENPLRCYYGKILKTKIN